MTSRPHTLLINPTVTSRGNARFPLGLLQLAAALDRSGSSQIIDGNVDRDMIEEALRVLASRPFDAVGITVIGGHHKSLRRSRCPSGFASASRRCRSPGGATSPRCTPTR